MIVQPSEIDEFEITIEAFVGQQNSETYYSESEAVLEWLCDHPHMLMARHFDEFVAMRERWDYITWWFRRDLDHIVRPIYRKPSGQWLALAQIPFSREKDLHAVPDTFGFHSRSTLPSLRKSTWESSEVFALEIKYTDVLRDLRRIAQRPSSSPRSIISPLLWTPAAQEAQSTRLELLAHGILSDLFHERKVLAEIAPRTLEDIVAELLRSHGMEVHVVRSAPQGGRDIIARGELIPGIEPLTLAVEVKHKAIVYRPEVEMALYQNRAFPALLFVTSGRFSAGVLQEKSYTENSLRLFLKDGFALGDWIRAYGMMQRWPSRRA